ncbi:hypothetical protein [Pontiella sulfatireligans]|uniref:hypothetical protein n=1 Tax=Pontiella sulfatireligans TaxID=2750658 RepID=UPI00109CDFC9|nr:hypothetical protein [Pontiella sulfatireligans]
MPQRLARKRFAPRFLSINREQRRYLDTYQWLWLSQSRYLLQDDGDRLAETRSERMPNFKKATTKHDKHDQHPFLLFLHLLGDVAGVRIDAGLALPGPTGGGRQRF